MPLVPKIKVLSDSYNQTLTLKDKTFYGIPNLLRNQVGIFCFAFKQTSYGEIIEQYTGNPLIDNHFTIRIKDSVYIKNGMVIIEIHNLTNTYSINEYVIDSNGNVYMSLINGNLNKVLTDTLSWSLIDITKTDNIKKIINFDNNTLNVGLRVLGTQFNSLFEDIARYEVNLSNKLVICSCFNKCTVSNNEKVRLLFEGMLNQTTKDDSQLIYEHILRLIE